MGAILALPFVLVFLWILFVVLHVLMGAWVYVAFPIMGGLGYLMHKADEPNRKAKAMRKEQRYYERAQLIAEYDRRHGR